MTEEPKNAKEWRKIIDECMKLAGTASECFTIPALTLSEILEKRDRVEADFKASGAEMVVEHVNRAGQVNLEQNPMIRLINNLNRDALTYMRELGITPKGLKQIKEKPLQEPREDPLEKILNKIARESTDDETMTFEKMPKNGL